MDISGIFSILNSATATYVDGYIKQNAECLYSCERGTKEEVVMTPTRKITTLFDQTLSGLNATQSVVARRPKLSTGKNAKRYYFTFDGVDDRMISGIDLNPASGKDDIVHVFLLFRLHSHNGSNQYFRNGLFGHDNGGWDKFVCYRPTSDNLLIAGISGADYVEVTSSDWQTKADASVLNCACRSKQKFLLGKRKEGENVQGSNFCWINLHDLWRSPPDRHCRIGWRYPNVSSLQRISYG